jgi:SAM-dependent methyltransferase
VNEDHLRYLASPEWAERLRSDLLPWVLAAGDLGDDVLEVGPGPGLTTDLLRERVARVTAVEVDESLAISLAARLAGTNVVVVNADANDADLPGERFSAATCFSMLHHMSSAEDQDRLFVELHRVLRRGGVLLGVDAQDTGVIRDAHSDDTFIPLDPVTLPSRLEAAGFRGTLVEEAEQQYRFIAFKPT